MSNAYRELLKKAKISDNYIDDIMGLPFIDGFELDDKGQVKNADKLIESLQTKHSSFVEKKFTKGAETETPPDNTGGKMTKEEIMAIKDRAKRQEAISENHELFGY
jgi:hypothetical protein